MTRRRSALTIASIGSLVAALAGAQPAVAAAAQEYWPDTFPAGAGRQHAGEAVRRWACERLGTFGLAAGIDSLRLEREEPLPDGGTRVLLRQLWHGLPVIGADARAIVSADGRLMSLISGLEPGILTALEPRVTPERAEAIAAAASGASALGTDEGLQTVTLAVARRASGDHLVWEVVRRHDGETARTLVDAVSGERLEVDAGISHAVGRVYPTDPRQPLEERELPGLLPGPPLRAHDFGIFETQFLPALPVAPGDYRYAPEDPEFDQVNTYWHVQHFLHDFLGSLGYPGPPDSVVVRVHFPLDPEVARTSGSLVTLGRPIPGFCFEPSRSHDILYHELGHAVIYGFGVQPGGDGREGNALHEGLADYFAAALTGDPAIGEWLYIVFPNGATRVDQPAPPWDYAHFDRLAFGGGVLSTAWANGMILSSGLWDLRRQIGASCDSLVLESLAYLPTVPTWGQFVNGMYLADRDHHGARFWTTIGEVLGRRGIRGAVEARLNGPAAPLPGQPVEFNALPCCGGTPGRYQWRTRRWCRGMPCEGWRDLGDGDTLRTTFNEDSDLELIVTSPFGEQDTASRFVVVVTPTLRFEGPTRVAKHATATWTTRLVAASPWRLVLLRQWLVPGARLDTLARVPSVTFAAEASFRLTAELTCCWTPAYPFGRSVVSQLDVEALADRPPRAADVWVRLTQSVNVASHAETRVELAQATAVRVAVYDVRGRERVRLADGPESRGERVIRWDTSVLEPGLYFVRAVTSDDQSAALRFLVIR